MPLSVAELQDACQQKAKMQCREFGSGPLRDPARIDEKRAAAFAFRGRERDGPMRVDSMQLHAEKPSHRCRDGHCVGRWFASRRPETRTPRLEGTGAAVRCSRPDESRRRRGDDADAVRCSRPDESRRRRGDDADAVRCSRSDESRRRRGDDADAPHCSRSDESRRRRGDDADRPKRRGRDAATGPSGRIAEGDTY